MSDAPQVSVLFVCMGNICRSPTAEAMFRYHAERACVQQHFRVDSAGTGAWHAGESPDGRMTEAAAAVGVQLTGSARQITPGDLTRFDHVVCMDADNLRDVQALGRGSDHVKLMLGQGDVPDPYYGGEDGFTRVVAMLDEACRGLLESLIEKHGLQA